MADGALNKSMIADVSRPTPVAARAARSRVRRTTASRTSVRLRRALSGRGDPGHARYVRAAGAYDVIYLLTYSALAAKSAPLTGEQLARARDDRGRRGGAAIEAGPTAFGDASNDLRNGIAINYEARPALDFDLRPASAVGHQVMVRRRDGATPYWVYFDPRRARPSTTDGTGACPFCPHPLESTTAPNATIHHLVVQPRTSTGRLQTLDLRVARHPSETLRYMLLRTLGYCLSFEDGIAFSKGGLSSTDEAPISIHDPTGVRLAWIDVGSPSAERLHKASKAARRVLLFTAASVDALRREASSRDPQGRRDRGVAGGPEPRRDRAEDREADQARAPAISTGTST
jgi:hypothetical protein